MPSSIRAPKNIKAGDTIGVLSTARKISKDEIAPCLNWLEEKGYHIQLGKSIGAEDRQFAGNDDLRKADLQDMLNDRGIDAILCARGGYGTIRIIDEIDFTRFMEQPKWIAGYSDVTALHMLLNTKIGVQTLHSQMALSFEKATDDARNTLLEALEGKALKYKWSGKSLNRSGSSKALVIGGNLSVIYSMSGGPAGGLPSNSILFLEDLDEYLYHIDRMMMNLKRSGKLNGLSGMMIGGMSDMNDNTIPFGKTAEEIIAEHVSDHKYPLCFDAPVGHIADNRTLILGREAELEVGEVVTFKQN